MNLAPDATKALYTLSGVIAKSDLDPRLRELVAVSVSTLNRCAHCIAIHWKKALDAGVEEEKLRLIAAYRGSNRFSTLEIAALDLAERMTRRPHHGVPVKLLDPLREDLDDEPTLMHLVYHIILMNAWNRLSITVGLEPRE